MSPFVHKVNPFGGILCMPYYYVWIVIIVSWLLHLLQKAYLRWVNKCDTKIWTVSNRDNELTKELQREFYNALQSVRYGGECLPEDVIHIIMDMLPLQISQQHQNYLWAVERSTRSHEQKQTTSKYLHSTKLIYPTCKLLANIACFVIILVRYASWHHEHSELSNWSKYCAFIISMLYVPTFKFNALWNWLYKDDLQWIAKVNIGIDAALLLWFGIIALPIWFTGIFIYIPVAVMGACFAACIVFVPWLINAVLFFCCYDRMDAVVDLLDDGCVGSESVQNGSYAFVVSLGVMWITVITVMSTIEFYDSKDWVYSYKLGISGNYCQTADYLSKWQEYPADVQFLIISWFLF